MFREYFVEVFAVNFPSPPILSFSVFLHTKREYDITLWTIMILKSFSALDNFSHEPLSIHVCLVTQLCPALYSPHGLQHTRLLCPWGFSRQEYQSGLPCPPLGDLPNPGIKPRSPALQADSLPAEPPGKHKNPGVGSLSLLQGLSLLPSPIFLTQELHRGLLHCRQILYQLSYQGSPSNGETIS